MRMTYVLAGAFVIAGGLALVGVGSRPSPAVAPDSPNMALETAVAPAPVEERAPAPNNVAAPKTLEGEALETIEVPEYTYIRVGQKGAPDEWVAVSSAKVNVGDHVRIGSQTVMTNFVSAKLKRTFPRIHFGVLASDDAAQVIAAPRSTTAMPGHPTAPPTNGDIAVDNIDKADGPNGYRIAEIFAQKKSLAGKSTRVRGVVVKLINGVMGKNFIHLRDGSGSETQANNDLTVTTNETLERGQTVVLEGTVTLDKDLGAGYHYDVLLEDATAKK